MTNKPPRFLKNTFSWPMDRSSRTFRAFVVEPERYAPSDHGEIFIAALSSLISGRQPLLDEFDAVSVPLPLDGFDLLSFPEAFLPTGVLSDTLALIHQSGMQGCVHVGLRPSAADANHLFTVAELIELLATLRAFDHLEQADLDAFQEWLKQQQPSLNFNVGCLFTVDIDGKVRVCLHPKLVRSKFEIGALPEDHMEEANLLTVVALRPSDKTFQTVHIQPLICSDALHLRTDRAGSRPLEALQNDANCLGEDAPDHIDIVSVVTCTPQPERISSKSVRYREWHDEFKESFVRATNDAGLGRHHHAVFVLSNFRSISADLQGGLSGAFVPAGHERDIRGFVISCWGREEEDQPTSLRPPSSNRWSTPEDRIKDWSDRCYIASLDPYAEAPEGIVARMFGFTLLQLPRQMLRWQTKLGLVKCAVRTATRTPTQPLTFEAR